MARIRTMKPEMWQDEKLAPLDPLTRLVFLGLISMADDAGRVLDNVRLIDAFIFPETEDSSREALASLSRIARVRRGTTASGQRIIEIANWTKHQKIDHPNFSAALPKIVKLQEVTPPLANGSRGAREALAPHTNDQYQRPVPTTSTNDQLSDVADAPPKLTLVSELSAVVPKAAKPARVSAPKFPNFDMALCQEMYDEWTGVFGGVQFGYFRKCLGPLFSKPEAERPAHHATNVELVAALKAYTQFGAGPWGDIAKAAKTLAAVALTRRKYRDDPILRAAEVERIVTGRAA